MSEVWRRGAGGVGPSNNGDSGSSQSEYSEMILSMVNMLSSPDQSNAQRVLAAMTGSPESCLAWRKAGCIPLLIQILHPLNLPPDSHPSPEAKLRAAKTLKNIVTLNIDEKMRRREVRVLKLLEGLRSYTQSLKGGNLQERDEGGLNSGENMTNNTNNSSSSVKDPVFTSTALMRLSFDEEHRKCMCLLGAVHTIAELISAEHSVYGRSENSTSIVIRRYCGMALTNLTFKDKRNKALLCSMKDFMTALVAQLESPSEDVCLVTASVLRNLSWQAESSSKQALMEAEAVPKLVQASIRATNESTLKATLSALLNLSSHSLPNRAAISESSEALKFLIGLLESPTLGIVENAGGVLRYVSSLEVGGRTREILRTCKLLDTLVHHLDSPSIAVVSNACCILWHLSSTHEDQRRLVELGAVRKLRSLCSSKHERIKQGASSALSNILNSTPPPPPPHPPLTLRVDKNIEARVEDNNKLHMRNNGTKERDEREESTKSLPRSLPIGDEPLDLSISSASSTPSHTLHARGEEFGPRSKTVPFLNPPLTAKSSNSYDSPKNYSSCPEFLGFIQPAHRATPLDFSKTDSSRANPRGGRNGGEEVVDITINYSLHYPESEAECSVAKNGGGEDDTLKTYFCEGTPLNFSTSNSLTDLSAVGLERKKLLPIQETEAPCSSSSIGGGGGGQSHDEIPTKYCTEHTPAIFSRSSSLSSLSSSHAGSGGGGGERGADFYEEVPPSTKSTSSIIPPSTITTTTSNLPNFTNVTSSSSVSNAKEMGPGYSGASNMGGSKLRRMVTFSANETPLMFSRSSSVNSLESEGIVNDTGEDGGSVQSEFSRRASEVVSPSELPDSPRGGQLVEMSKNNNSSDRSNNKDEESEDVVKIFSTGGGESRLVSGLHSVRSLSPLEIDGETLQMKVKMEPDLPGDKTDGGSETIKPALAVKPIPAPRNISKCEDIVDEMKVFGVEDTPFGLSTATSLSDIIGELDKEEEEETPPPPLPPKPLLRSNPTSSNGPNLGESGGKSINLQEAQASHFRPLAELGPKSPALETSNNGAKEGIYSDAQILQKCINAGKAASRGMVKSKSEMSKLGKNSKIPPSLSGEFKKNGSSIDPELADLIMRGKSRVRAKPILKVRAFSEKKVESALEKNEKSEVVMEEEKKSDKKLKNEPIVGNKNEKSDVEQDKNCEKKSTIESETEKVCVTNSPKVLNKKIKELTISGIETSITSINEDTFSLSVPSLSISTAFRLAESSLTNNESESNEKEGNLEKDIRENKGISESIMAQSTITSVEPPSELISSSTNLEPAHKLLANQNTLNSSTNDNLAQNSQLSAHQAVSLSTNGKLDTDLNGSMISVESLVSEIATFTLNGEGGSGSELDGSLNSLSLSTESKKTCKKETEKDKLKSYITKKPCSPKERRKEDPSRYLTRTISSQDSSPILSRKKINSNYSSNDESSESGSPKGIRGRRKVLYSSLPNSRKNLGPPVPPKPKNVGAYVRPNRTSELRAASRDQSPSRTSPLLGKKLTSNSSNSSLNNILSSSGKKNVAQNNSNENEINSNSKTITPQTPSGAANKITESDKIVRVPLVNNVRKTPPRPPVRVNSKSEFAGVGRSGVRSSSSSIGFLSDESSEFLHDPSSSTLPKSLKKEKKRTEGGSKMQKLTEFWNVIKGGSGSSEKKGRFYKLGFGGGEKRKKEEKKEDEKIDEYSYVQNVVVPLPPISTFGTVGKVGEGGSESRMTSV